MSGATLVSWPGDLKVVNAARVSFAKESSELTEKDLGLMSFLARNNHWSPFGHGQLVFLRKMRLYDAVQYLAAETAGFERIIVRIIDDQVTFFERGSLFAYLRTSDTQPVGLMNAIVDRFPGAAAAYNLTFRSHGATEPFIEDWTDAVVDENRFRAALSHNKIFLHDFDMGRLMSVTFRIKTTIYVARQLVKHQVNLCWNEVSRRYVTADPEFEDDVVWRLAAENVKQGSAGEFDCPEADIIHRHQLQSARMAYEKYLALGIAPEQARIDLPSTS